MLNAKTATKICQRNRKITDGASFLRLDCSLEECRDPQRKREAMIHSEVRFKERDFRAAYLQAGNDVHEFGLGLLHSRHQPTVLYSVECFPLLDIAQQSFAGRVHPRFRRFHLFDVGHVVSPVTPS
jgi:hypothetical protein